MKRRERTLHTLRPLAALAVVAGAAALYPLAAEAQASRMLARMHSHPGEFYLFDDTDVKVLDYRREREVRICNDTRRHKVPLEVNYDGKTAKVRPGDCFSFEAKTVSLSPAESLSQGWDLSGTIEHHATLWAESGPRQMSQADEMASPGQDPEERQRTAEAPSDNEPTEPMR